MNLRIPLFVLGAALFNLVVLVLCFALLALAYVVLLVPHIPAGYAHYGFIPLFVLSAFLSFIVYRLVFRINIHRT